jgi:outer membrane protein assembly factor BamB
MLTNRISSLNAALLCAGLLGLLAVGPAVGAESSTPDAGSGDRWPQWRGPGGVGVASDSGVPVAWDLEHDLLWKTEIEGRGLSSPVIWGDRLFLTTAIEGEVIAGAKAPVHMMNGEPFKHPDSVGSDRSHTFVVLALDGTSGEVLWRKVAYEGRVYDDRHKQSSYASPTPATDGERVYAYFGSQGVYAYDFEGALQWSRDIGDIRTVGMGVGSSPVLYEDLVLIQADSGDGESSALVALDKRTGEEAWRVPRAVEVSWSTPLLVTDTSGRTQLVTNGNQLIVSYDPGTGREIWRVKGLESNAIHTPLAAGAGMVVLTAGYPRKVTAAVKLDLEGDHSQEDAWAWSYNKGTAYVPSNLIYEGRLFLVSDAGVITCLDAATGEVIYEGGRLPTPGRFGASPIVVDGKLLLISSEGDATFVGTGSELEVLSQSSVGEPVYSSPSVAGGRLLIRGERHLFAIGKKGS